MTTTIRLANTTLLPEIKSRVAGDFPIGVYTATALYDMGKPELLKAAWDVLEPIKYHGPFFTQPTIDGPSFHLQALDVQVTDETEMLTVVHLTGIALKLPVETLGKRGYLYDPERDAFTFLELTIHRIHDTRCEIEIDAYTAAGAAYMESLIDWLNALGHNHEINNRKVYLSKWAVRIEIYPLMGGDEGAALGEIDIDITFSGKPLTVGDRNSCIEVEVVPTEDELKALRASIDTVIGRMDKPIT